MSASWWRSAARSAFSVRAAPALVTLVPIGPLTNIALLLAAHPDVKPRIARIVAMGGAFSGGNTTEAAEFNIHCDPEAARRVLVEEDVPITLVPLDLTLRCAVDGAWLDRSSGFTRRNSTLSHPNSMPHPARPSTGERYRGT